MLRGVLKAEKRSEGNESSPEEKVKVWRVSFCSTKRVNTSSERGEFSELVGSRFEISLAKKPSTFLRSSCLRFLQFCSSACKDWTMMSGQLTSVKAARELPSVYWPLHVEEGSSDWSWTSESVVFR